MNDKFEIKQILNNNRGLFSKIQFGRHEQIIQCEPIAWATLQQTKTKNCNWCLMQKQLVKCSQCKSYYYCSTDCQKNDWKYHKLQCKVFAKMTSQKGLSVHKQITTEFVFNVRLYYILKEDKQKAKLFYEMCSLEDFQPPQKRQHFQQLSVMMMKSLQLQLNETNMSQLLRQFNIVAVNAFTIQDVFYTTNGVAIGIYWPANYLNHDCSANCIQIFDGRYLKIIAEKNVSKGQELTIRYTSPLDLQKQRSKFLKENYLFDCFCQLCQVQKMLNTSFVYIKCPECKQSKIRKINALKPIEEEIAQVQIVQSESKHESKKNGLNEYQCTNCKKQIDQSFLQGMARQIQALPQKVEKLSTYKQKKQAFLALKKVVDLKHPSFCKALESVYLSSIDEALQCQSQQSQAKIFNQSYILLSEILKNIPSWYKIEESEMISNRFFTKLNEMSKLSYNLGKLAKCMDYLQKAKKSIQKLTFRHKYKQLQELQKRYDEVKIELSISKTKLMK